MTTNISLSRKYLSVVNRYVFYQKLQHDKYCNLINKYNNFS